MRIDNNGITIVHRLQAYLFLLLNTLTNHITLGTLALECAVEGKRLAKMAYREGGR